MINLNFLGLSSPAVAQQKGKSNNVKSNDPENGSTLLEGDSQERDAAFPDVLMQLLLGQQLPIAVQVKPDQQLIPSDVGTDGETITSDKPLFSNAQPIHLRQQLLAGEMKKQSTIQKSTAQVSTSVELKIVPNQSEYIELSELSHEALNVKPAEIDIQKQNINTELSPLVSEAKITLEGINILPAQMQPKSNLQPLATPSGESKSIGAGEGNKNGNGTVKPHAEVLEMNIPKVNKELNSEAVITETESSNLPKNKLSQKVGDLYTNEILQPPVDTTIAIPNNKLGMVNKELELIPIANNDFHQKGILSAVVTQNGKMVKKDTSEATVIDKSNSVEKHSPVSSPIDIVKNETHNSENGSFTPKENFEQQPLFGKNAPPTNTREGQQVFAAMVEEKNNITVPKPHQTEIASFLRQQDAVNNIVEQLAKNVTLSIDKNNSQIKISLKPEALGEVMLKVSMEQGKVSTQIEVQQPQIKAVIEANLQILRDSLSSKGVVVERIDISTAQYSLNEKSSNQGQQRSTLKNYSGKEIAEEDAEQTKLFGYNTVDYVV